MLWNEGTAYFAWRVVGILFIITSGCLLGYSLHILSSEGSDLVSKLGVFVMLFPFGALLLYGALLIFCSLLFTLPSKKKINSLL